jgi:ribosomal protein L40E
MGKYLSIIGLFVVGIIIVIAGVYYFITSPANTFEYQLGIILMLVGLLVTGVGAIRGKRTMRSVGYFADYPPEAPPRSARPAPAQPMPAPEAPSQPPAPRPTPSVPATQPAKAGTKPAKAPEKVVKVLVCPKCGSENQVTDMFCFNCGKKLRPKRAAK